MGMKKYFLVVKTTLLDQLAYPARFFSSLFVDGIILLVWFLLWQTIFQGKAAIEGFTLPSIITYYSVVFALKNLGAGWEPSSVISKSIRDGSLSLFLLKPLHFGIYLFSKTSTSNVLKSIFPALVLAFGTLFFEDLLLWPHNLLLFTLSVLLAILIAYLVYSLIGLIGFWTLEVWGIAVASGRLIAILNGSLLPLSFFPDSLLRVAKFLPFQYMFYVPVSIYLGKAGFGEALRQITFQVGWVVVLSLLYMFLWRRGIKRYDSAGI